VVPDNVINGFARVLGVEVPNDDNMDVDDSKSKNLRGFDAVRGKVKELMREGYSASQILSQLHDLIILHPTLNSRKKSESAMSFAEADKALCDGADEELWMLEVGLTVHKALSK